MVNEVESILNEIRERVRSDYEQANAPLTLVASAKDPQPAPSRSLNGMDELENSEALNRLSAHLTTTGRSWDRLPPLYSNRRGSAARLELWLKARLKSMSRWFTWEQVNFNSAVHHALAETLHALSAQRQDLAGMRAELHRDSEAWRGKLAHTDQELSGLRAAIESLTAEIKKRDANQEARYREPRSPQLRPTKLVATPSKPAPMQSQRRPVRRRPCWRKKSRRHARR